LDHGGQGPWWPENTEGNAGCSVINHETLADLATRPRPGRPSREPFGRSVRTNRLHPSRRAARPGRPANL